MEFRVLGGLEVVRADGQPVRLRGRKPRLLLAVLLLHANQVVTVDRLIDALWGDQPPATARQTVQYFVHELRKALGGAAGDGKDLVETHSSGYLLRVEPGALDLDRFEAALRRAHQAKAAGDQRGVAEALAAGLALWRGPAVADFAGEAFAQPFVARLEEERLTAVEDLAEARLALGDDADLGGELAGLSRSQPLRERVHGLLMVALYRSGRQAEALAVYRRFRDRLVEELGLEPGAELRRLEARVLAQDPTLAAPARQGPAQPGAAPPPAVQDPDVVGADEKQEPAGAVRAPSREGRPEERRTITALVAGIASSAATSDPEDAHARSGRALEALLQVVSRYGGTVVAVFGGTVLAVFGVPSAREDDPERAVRAALAICQDPPDGTTIRVGVDTGEAVVAPRLGWGGTAGGGQLAVAGGVTGAVLDTAARLQAVAPPGGVLVGRVAYRATQRRIRYEPAGAASRPVGPRSRIGMAVDAEPDRRSPLMERRHELKLLAGILNRSRQVREPQLVTVVGAPGIGKTRLVAELGRQAEADPELITWRQGRSLPYGQREDGDVGGVVFWALVEIVRAHTGINDTDTAQAAGAKLDAAAADLFADPAEAALVSGQLRRLLHMDAPDEINAEQRQAAFAAWARFLEAVADDRPLVLVFEDLHWADDALLEFVDQLVKRAGPVPLLVVCTGRPELLSHRPGWGGGSPNALSVSLGPLTKAGSAMLLDTLLAADNIPLDETTRRMLLAKADGNPLFLEEYVRMLRDRGAGGGDLPVPETVQQLITARIDQQLDAADRRLLQDLAVVGTPDWVEPLADFTGLSPQQLQAGLARLERQELLRHTRGGVNAQPAYAFRHALIRDVAYNQILRGDRADKHRRIARWLESLGPDRAAERAEQLAYHYQQALTLTRAAGQALGDLAERARLAFRAAGDRAAGLGALAPAARYYEQAVALWPPDDPAHARLLLQLGRLVAFSQHAGESYLVAARDAFRAAGNAAGIAEAEGQLSLLDRKRGRTAGADQHAAAAAAADPSGLGAAQGLAGRAMGAMIRERHAEAIQLGHQAARLAAEVGAPEPESTALVAAGTSRLLTGDLDGIDDLDRGIALADSHALPTLHFCRFDLAYGLWMHGDVPRAYEVAAAARTAAEEAAAAVKSWFDVLLAAMAYAAGRWDTAVRLADQFLGREGDARDEYMRLLAHVVRGRVRLARGDAAGGLADADDAVARGHAVGDVRFRQAAIALAGRAHLADGDHKAATGRLTALLDELADDPPAGCLTTDLGVLMADLDCPADALPEGLPPTRWTHAVQGIVAGDLSQAVKELDGIGSPADAALVRLLAARQYVTAGRAGPAHIEAAAAREFAEQAGATAWLAEADRLLPGQPRHGRAGPGRA